MLYKDLSNELLDSAFTVYQKIGRGLLEKCYLNALAIELEFRGYKIQREKAFKVFYRQQMIGDYFADLVLEDKIIVEGKVVKQLANIHAAQLLHYLSISKLRVGYLFNFKDEFLEWKRLIL